MLSIYRLWLDYKDRRELSATDWQEVFITRLVAFMPNLLFPRKGCIATTPPWWRRIARQLAPQHGGRDCCWYHQSDWHKATRTAIRYL
jgi:hypothetical protein